MAVVELKIEKRNTNFRKIMHKHVDEICDLLEDGGELAAYAIVGFDYKGRYTNAWRIADDAHFGATLLPVMVAEALRRRSIEKEIEGILRGDLSD